jgi:hypothetical protein
MLSHANFVATRGQLQQMVKTENLISAASKFYRLSKDTMIVYTLPSTLGGVTTTTTTTASSSSSSSTTTTTTTSEPMTLSASNMLNSNSKGRMKVVMQVMISQAENEGVFMHAPDIDQGIGWQVLALKMVLYAFAPECFEVNVPLI